MPDVMLRIENHQTNMSFLANNSIANYINFIIDICISHYRTHVTPEGDKLNYSK